MLFWAYFTMWDVLISSITSSCGSIKDLPLESVSLNFPRVEYAFTFNGQTTTVTYERKGDKWIELASFD